MASPAVLDFERLLSPISDEQPSGPELRDDPASSGLFHQIKAASETARNAEKILLRASITADEDEAGEEDVARPDWSKQAAAFSRRPWR